MVRKAIYTFNDVNDTGIDSVPINGIIAIKSDTNSNYKEILLLSKDGAWDETTTIATVLSATTRWKNNHVASNVTSSAIGNVASTEKNIETQFTKPYKHNIFIYDQIHEPNESALTTLRNLFSTLWCNRYIVCAFCFLRNSSCRFDPRRFGVSVEQERHAPGQGLWRCDKPQHVAADH